MTEQTEQLPRLLQFQNLVMSAASAMNPIWWASLGISDARDRRRRRWRLPTTPRQLDFTVPPGIAPIEISQYLWGLGIQTAMINLQWEIHGGIIYLSKSILVPGRQHKWAKTALHRFLAGDPVPQRGPTIEARNLEMAVSRLIGSFLTGSLDQNGRRLASRRKKTFRLF